jgi:hypothetical protein
MKDLIEALNIFLKYGNPDYPTHCQHDVLLVMIDPALVSDEDKIRLDQLSFVPEKGMDPCFRSFRYGSC